MWAPNADMPLLAEFLHFLALPVAPAIIAQQSAANIFLQSQCAIGLGRHSPCCKRMVAGEGEALAGEAATTAVDRNCKFERSQALAEG